MKSKSLKLASLLFVGVQLLHPVPPTRADGWTGFGGSATPSSVGQKVGAAEGGGERGSARLRPILAASAFVLGSVAVVLELESDRAYARYQGTADPLRMRSWYDTAERKKDLSTAALVGAELAAAALVATYLVQKRPAEPDPGPVIIGFSAAPGGAAVRVRW